MIVMYFCGLRGKTCTGADSEAGSRRPPQGYRACSETRGGLGLRSRLGREPGLERATVRPSPSTGHCTLHVPSSVLPAGNICNLDSDFDLQVSSCDSNFYSKAVFKFKFQLGKFVRARPGPGPCVF
jgi:hypothetical protein